MSSDRSGARMTQTDEPASERVPPEERALQTPLEAMRHAANAAPPHIELEACLLAGRGDSRRLLVTWFVKKSFWWMLFGGAALASVVHFVEHVENELQVNYRSPESVEHGLLSAWVLVVLAVLLRVAIAWIAVALAYPLARAHETGLAPRTGVNRHYATLSDRYKVAKAYRSLRWTHHVRQVALDRVSPGPGWWRRWDPILDVVNVVAVVVFFGVGLFLTTVSVTDLLM